MCVCVPFVVLHAASNLTQPHCRHDRERRKEERASNEGKRQLEVRAGRERERKRGKGFREAEQTESFRGTKAGRTEAL